jgi:glycosyl transferase family 25
MNVFVVNLESSQDRRKFMHEQLNALGMSHEFFPAVDGRQITAEQLSVMCDMEVVNKWSELLTPGMIGCSLSHYGVYRRMVADEIQMALVLEDDARVSDRVPGLLDLIETGMRDGRLNSDEIILLYYQSKDIVEFSTASTVELDSTVRLYHPIQLWRPITTTAYVITLACAKRLVELVYPIRYSPDSWAVYYRENAIAGVRCVLPLPVESGFFRSDIGYEQHKWHHRVVKLLELKNVFPVPQLLRIRRRALAQKQNRFRLSADAAEWQVKTLVP